MAEKLSVLKPQRLQNLLFCFLFSYYNYGETVTIFEKDMFRKESLTYKQNSNILFLVILHIGAKSPVNQ